MRLVILESPYSGDVEANLTYARACLRDCLRRGEAPIASHLLYTQPGVLDDNIAVERKAGIDAGLAWLEVADATVVYTDRGISEGMKYGIAEAQHAGIPVEWRRLVPAGRCHLKHCGNSPDNDYGCSSHPLVCPYKKGKA